MKVTRRTRKTENVDSVNMITGYGCPTPSKRKNLKHQVKVKLDLTKKRSSIFSDALKLSKNFENVNFVMVDINCRLKVVFKNGSSKFFSDCDNLREILNMDR